MIQLTNTSSYALPASHERNFQLNSKWFSCLLGESFQLLKWMSANDNLPFVLDFPEKHTYIHTYPYISAASPADCQRSVHVQETRHVYAQNGNRETIVYTIFLPDVPMIYSFFETLSHLSEIDLFISLWHIIRQSMNEHTQIIYLTFFAIENVPNWIDFNCWIPEAASRAAHFACIPKHKTLKPRASVDNLKCSLNALRTYNFGLLGLCIVHVCSRFSAISSIRIIDPGFRLG